MIEFSDVRFSQAKALYDEIVELSKAIEKEENPTKLWGFLRRKRKLQKLYNVCINDEIHQEIIQLESTTRGY